MASLENPLIEAMRPLTSRLRTDKSAVRVWNDRPDGKPNWKPGWRTFWTDEPLTDEAMAHHLNGGGGRGACPIREGESVTMVGLLDLDSHGGETSWTEMCLVAGTVAEALRLAEGVEPHVFRSSGGKGIHIVCMWEEPQDAYSVRRMLIETLEAVGLRSGAGGRGVADGLVEVFPKQDEVRPGGSGNYFILPLAGASELLEYCDLSGAYVGLGRVAPVWAFSAPVTVREHPVRAVRAPVEGGGAGTGGWRAALDALGGVDSLSYEDWRDVGFAIHHETGGSAEGLALLHDWSSRLPDYDADFIDRKIWGHADGSGDRGAVVTGGTIKHLAARLVGWREPIVALGAVEDVDPVVRVGDGGRGGVVCDELGSSVVGADIDSVLKRDKNGYVKATLRNVLAVVRTPAACGARIEFDSFDATVKITYADSRGGWSAWRPVTDTDNSRLRETLTGDRLRFHEISRQTMSDVIDQVAEENAFDSAQNWLGSLPAWDGVERCPTFLAQYFGTEDTPYTRAVGLYLWTALAGRVLEPGCQADMALVLQGSQGLRKTSGVAALAPTDKQFAEIDLSKPDDALARLTCGVLVGEISELQGLSRRDAEGIKAWVSRREEKWTPKYKERAVTYKRRMVLIGTTNEDEFLADGTGNRRWLPVRAGKVDADAVKRDRDMLWAEARVRFMRGGVAWEEAEKLAPAEHHEYRVRDSWEDVIGHWLEAPDTGAGGDGTRPVDRPFLRVGEVMQEALKMAPKDATRAKEMRVAGVLKSLGFTPARMRVGGGNPARVWVSGRHTEIGEVAQVLRLVNK